MSFTLLLHRIIYICNKLTMIFGIDCRPQYINGYDNYDENNENELTRYFCCRKRFIYHPLPNAEPNEPPTPALAAIGSNDSMLGLAAPTKGVESC